MCARISSSNRPPASPDDDATSADAHAELQELADELRRAALEVVWRQWRALGAGAATRAASGGQRSAASGEPAGAQTGAQTGARRLQTLIDPEALVLVSLVLVHDERRLADLLHDWAARNSDLLGVQRIRNLMGDYAAALQDGLVRQLAWFATVARDAGKDLRWRPVAQASTEAPRGAQRPAGNVTPAGQEPSEYLRSERHGRAAAHGSENRPAKSRATRARLLAPAALTLRLRLGFGVGVKADLLAFLLARAEEWATVRDIAVATSYTAAAVRRAAEDLTAARLIETRAAQPTRYRVPFAAWASLLGFEDRAPRWGRWHERFRFTAELLHWAVSARERPLSPYALEAHGRELLEPYRRAFERDSMAAWSIHSDGGDWPPRSLALAVHALARHMRETA